MNKKKSNHISPNQNVVSVFKVGGIKAIINTNGVLETNKSIPETTKKRIEKTLKNGLENILDGWLVEGEFKNDTFYVNYIRDDSGKVLDVHDTKDWANIMGFAMIIPDDVSKFKDANKRRDIRPESSFMASDYENMTTGKSGWRNRVIEVMRDGL